MNETRRCGKTIELWFPKELQKSVFEMHRKRRNHQNPIDVLKINCVGECVLTFEDGPKITAETTVTWTFTGVLWAMPNKIFFDTGDDFLEILTMQGKGDDGRPYIKAEEIAKIAARNCELKILPTMKIFTQWAAQATMQNLQPLRAGTFAEFDTNFLSERWNKSPRHVTRTLTQHRSQLKRAKLWKPNRTGHHKWSTFREVYDVSKICGYEI